MVLAHSLWGLLFSTTSAEKLPIFHTLLQTHPSFCAAKSDQMNNTCLDWCLKAGASVCSGDGLPRYLKDNEEYGGPLGPAHPGPRRPGGRKRALSRPGASQRPRPPPAPPSAPSSHSTGLAGHRGRFVTGGTANPSGERGRKKHKKRLSKRNPWETPFHPKTDLSFCSARKPTCIFIKSK